VGRGALHLVSAKDFDPEGDGQEDPANVGLAIDGNATTGWQTEQYQAPATHFGGGKDGVGLYVTLSGAADVSTVEVDTAETGWSARIYVADQPAAALDGWGTPAATGTNLGIRAVLHLDPARHGTVVLVWLTQLPESGRLTVNELRVRS